MCLASKLYFLLVEILHQTHDLEAGASLLQADRAIAKRFGVSESAARNWRRCTSANVSPSVYNLIVQICSQIAPERLADLELLRRLSQGIHEVKLAADTLVDELDAQVYQEGANWHIYSGPLRMAFDPNSNPEYQRELMTRSSMIVERLLEMRVESADISSIAELIRYSVHGWHANGLFRIRQASLSSTLSEIRANHLDKVEAALYIGDGCAGPTFFLGCVNQAKAYLAQALTLLEDLNRAEEPSSYVSVEDAYILFRSLQTFIACHEGYDVNQPLIRRFVRDYDSIAASNEWIEAIRQEAFGYIVICQKDFDRAAAHFEESGNLRDRWLRRYNVPFCTIAPHSLTGYALLKTHGPTDDVRLRMSEGLLKTLDHGGGVEQVQARFCLSLFFADQGNDTMAGFHRQKAEAIVQQHNLTGWFAMVEKLLNPRQSLASR